MALRRKIKDFAGTESRSAFTPTSGPRAGMKGTKIERGGRVFHQYDDAGTGLGKETVEVKLGRNAPVSQGAGGAATIPGQGLGAHVGVTQSGRVVHSDASGKRVVFNAAQTQAALAKNPLLKKLYSRMGNAVK